MAQIDAQPQEPGFLARLSSTITVSDQGHQGIRLVREGRSGYSIISLSSATEDKLLDLLLTRKARRGDTIQG